MSGALSEVGAFLYSHSTDKYPQCVGAPYRHSCNASICLLHTCGRGSGCPDEAISGRGVNIQCPGALPGPVTGGTDPINLRYRKTTAHALHKTVSSIWLRKQLTAPHRNTPLALPAAGVDIIMPGTRQTRRAWLQYTSQAGVEFRAVAELVGGGGESSARREGDDYVVYRCYWPDAPAGEPWTALPQGATDRLIVHHSPGGDSQTRPSRMSMAAMLAL